VLTTFPLSVGGQLRLSRPADNASLLLRRLPDTAAGSPRLRVEAGRFRRGWSFAGAGLEPAARGSPAGGSPARPVRDRPPPPGPPPGHTPAPAASPGGRRRLG
jgi:hypothetical protein